MPFSKAIYQKQYIWLNLLASLTLIIPLMCVNFTKLFTKQAHRAWYHELHQFLVDSRFKNSHSDTSLFVLNIGPKLIYLLVYVDDIIINGNSEDLVSQVVDFLAQQFSLKDLGTLSYFLGVEVVPHRHGILLSQRRYIKDLLT